MSQPYTNICLWCRKKAQLSQEAWAEKIGVSVETVKAWEGDRRIPSNYHVSLMAEACGDYWPCYQHLRQTQDSLDVLPDAKRTILPLAAMQLINRIFDFADNHRDRQLLKIAEDGVIDQKERPAYDQIIAELKDIIAAVFALRYSEGGAHGPREN